MPKKIAVINVETGKYFSSLAEAARWANSTPNLISLAVKACGASGTLPGTEKPAHWRLYQKEVDRVDRMV